MTDKPKTEPTPTVEPNEADRERARRWVANVGLFSLNPVDTDHYNLDEAIESIAAELAAMREEERQKFKGCASEIMAGAWLTKAIACDWNRACRRAKKLVMDYVAGKGLLQ